MAVVSVNLISSSKNPDVQGHAQEQCRNNGQIAIMVVSLSTTLGTFMLTMIGAGSSLAGLQIVANRISTAGASMAQPRGNSVTESGAKVLPVESAAV